MAPATVPTTEPTEIIAGDTLRWDRVVDDYPPSAGWSLLYAFRGISTLDVTAAASADQTGYEITVASGASGALGAGTYAWTAWVQNGDGERYTVGRGRVVVQANPTTVGAGDGQSHWEKLKPLLEAALQRRVTVDMKAYALGTSTATREELAEYRSMLAECNAQIALLQADGADLPPIGATFVRHW